jgi:hypothetical protein
LWEQIFSRFELKITSRERELQWSKFAFLKKRRRKEVKEDFNLMANGRFQCLVALRRFHCLVAFERFHAWWPLKVPLLSGQWKEKEKHFFPFFHFSPTNFI